MFHKLVKNFFNLLINIIKFTQVTLVFLTFFVILYWLLQLSGVKFIEFAAPFFESIKALIHTFYNRTVEINNIKVDFSFLLSAFIFLLIAQILKFAAEGVEFLEKKYDSIHNSFKRKAENSFNKELELQYIAKEQMNNKILLFIKFNLTDLTKDSFFHRDVNVGVEEKQKEALQKFSEIFDKGLSFQKNLLNDGLLLYFNDFNNVEKIIAEVGKCAEILKKKYAEEQWKANYLASIDVYANAGEISQKVKKLTLLTKLDLKNKIVCMPTFKQRYSLIKNPVYKIEGQGTYRLEEDKDQEDIYILEV